MNSQDMLMQAVSDAVDEILAECLDPQAEVDRLKSNVESAFWIAYNERNNEQED